MDTTVDIVRSELLATMSVLMRRRADTADPAERPVITSSLRTINAELDRLDQVELLDAAQAVAISADALEEAVGAARLRPFDSYLTTANAALVRLGQIAGEIHHRQSLPHASERFCASAAEPRSTTAAGQGRPTPSRSCSYADLVQEYERLYGGCRIREEHTANVEYYVARLLRFQAVYKAVAADLGTVPWQLVGIVHGMESGFDFTRHLHNGDPLTARTRHVPKGRPAAGTPPFTWRASAVDALMLQGLHRIEHWQVARLLYELERYNGFGYRRRGLASPYLWSFTNLYSKGKYVRDGEFDPEAVSRQCGAAAMLLGLAANGAGLGR